MRDAEFCLLMRRARECRKIDSQQVAWPHKIIFPPCENSSHDNKLSKTQTS